MDVGHVIAAQIRGIFLKLRVQLFFPSIVTKLCFNMYVMEGEPEVAVKEVITKSLDNCVKGLPASP